MREPNGDDGDKVKQFDDVIAAIATPLGEGGIGVVRISGKGAINVADEGFRGRMRLQDAKTHTLHYGMFVNKEGEVIDEVVAAVFRAPHSYTAEDVVEISCHGGIYVTKKVLESVIAFKARLADPGEFTKRAFLNGRIDLSQAEAVADLIRAQSEASRRANMLQLQGLLSVRINRIRDRLMHACSLVELELDFVEESITLSDKASLLELLEQSIEDLKNLLASYSYGRLCREGVKVVLVGRPNVGKSSLLNALLDENRAIVTEIPGTTRDVIEENIALGAMLFRLVDTAGIRETEDVVEKEGVQRTVQQFMEADLCLYVVDASSNNLQPDLQYVEWLGKLREGNPPIGLLVGNKCDLTEDLDNVRQALASVFPHLECLLISALTGAGLQELTDAIIRRCLPDSLAIMESSVVITNERHKEAVGRAIESLGLAKATLCGGLGGEVLAVDIRQALDSLGTIVGKVTSEDILNNIFSRFCIGK